MKGIGEKCLACETFKDFVSYEERSTFVAQVVCYDDDRRHYELLPLIGRQGRKPIDKRLYQIQPIIWILFVVSAILIIGAIVIENTVLLLLPGALAVMFFYTFFQLHLIDLKMVRVLEVSFCNETYWNLLNINENNETNRVRELHPHPEGIISNKPRLYIPLISELYTLVKYSVKLFKRERFVMQYMNKSHQSDYAISHKITEDMQSQMEAIKNDIRSMGLKIYDVVYEK